MDASKIEKEASKIKKAVCAVIQHVFSVPDFQLFEERIFEMITVSSIF
jgi:hypothetical protein